MISDHLTDEAIRERFELAVAAWNRGDFDRVTINFRDDVTFTSPYVVHAADGYAVGREAVMAHFRECAAEFSNLRLCDLFLANCHVAALLSSSSGGNMVWLLEYDGQQRVRGIIVCHSLADHFGKP